MVPETCPYEEADLLPVTLGEAVAANMRSHVDGCPKCRLRLEQLQREAAGLRRAGLGLTVTHPSPGGTQKKAGAHRPGMIGKYFVVGTLGQGGQAEVYRALHPELNKELVVKLSTEPLADDPEERNLLAREARILADLEHPNLARIYDLDYHEGRPFMVMEYVRGRNLEQVAQQEGLTPARSAIVVAQVARAAGFAHQQGVIHQDIKPSNIVIDELARPRLLDFGMARLRDAWRHATHQPRGGTPAFMAPEQARGEVDSVGPASDVFALGAVLYFLLTGRAPFEAEEWTDALKRAGACDFDRSALYQKGIPRRLANICLRAMAANPTDRHPRAEHLSADLERFLRPPWGVVALAAAAVLAAFAFLWHLWPIPTEPLARPAVPQQLVTLIQRASGGENRLFTPDGPQGLVKLAPLRKKDKLELVCHVPKGSQAALFCLDTAGVVQELTPLDIKPAGSEDRVRFPAQGVWQVQGPPGTVLFLFCANRRHRPTLEQIQELVQETLGDSRHRVLPPPDEQVLFLLNSDEVKVVGEQSRNVVDTPFSLVHDGLERLHARLRDRFDYVWGVALPVR
jgi:tRNA A-37 threonylcarbamoyl transferase component Bud32